MSDPIIEQSIIISRSRRSTIRRHHNEYGDSRIAEIYLVGDLDERQRQSDQYAYIEVLTTRGEVGIRNFLRGEDPYAVFAYYKKLGYTDKHFGFIPRREEANSLEYDAALERSRKAGAAYRDAETAYRARKIGDSEYLKARKAWERSQSEFDAAFERERDGRD